MDYKSKAREFLKTTFERSSRLGSLVYWISVEVWVYLTLGNQKYPLTVLEAAIPLVEKALRKIRCPTEEDEESFQYLKWLLSYCQKNADLNTLTVEVFPWEKIQDLPRGYKIAVALIAQYVVDADRWLSDFYSGRLKEPISYLAWHRNLLTNWELTNWQNRCYMCFVDGVDGDKEIPIPIPLPIQRKAEEVLEGFTHLRSKTGEELDKFRVHLVQKKREVEFELLKLVVKEVITPYLYSTYQG